MPNPKPITIDHPAYLKRLKNIRFLPLISLLLLLPILSHAWQLEPIDEESTVKGWTQEVVNSNFKAFKGYVEIKANIHHVLSEIKATETMREWYHNTIETERLQKLSDHQ